MRMEAVLARLAGEDRSYLSPFDWSETSLDPWEGVLTTGRAQAFAEADLRAPDPSQGSLGVLEHAEAQVGAPYVWAAANPMGPKGGAGSAFDCSGLTQYVLAKAGINVPHLASAQQAQLPTVGRNELQPGDLVFFNYGRKKAGIADHVGVYIGDGMMIDASSSEGEVVKRGVDWSHFIGGGSTGLSTSPQQTGPEGRKIGPVSPSTIFASLTGGPSLPAVLAALVAPEEYEKAAPKGVEPSFKGSNAATKRGLWRGFMDAGRPDLARMVKTKAFDAWIRRESGWRVDSVSRSYVVNGVSGVNGGLFQIRYPAHPWSHEYFSSGNQAGRFTASAYEQAKLIASHFNLTPAMIRRYGEAIANGNYHGWP